MRWASAVSRHAETERAVDEVAREAIDALSGASIDLAFAFFTPEHAVEGRAWERLRERLAGAVLLGCSAASCIGGGVEVEEGPSFALVLAHLPGVSLHPFRLSREGVSGAALDPARWRALVGVGSADPLEALETAETPAFVLLGDPFTGDTEAVLRGLTAAYPGAVQVGGLSSGRDQSAGNVLAFGGELLAESTLR